MSYTEFIHLYDRMALLVLVSVAYGISVSFGWVTRKLKLKKLKLMFLSASILSGISIAYLIWELSIIYAKASSQYF